MLYTIFWFADGLLFAKDTRYFANAMYAYEHAAFLADSHFARFGRKLTYNVLERPSLAE